jgi:molybdopterin converting factor small subunit
MAKPIYHSFIFQSIMTVKVLVPTPLQKFTNNQATIECDGSNIDQLIDALESNCPGIKARICDESGQPRRGLSQQFDRFYRFRNSILKVSLIASLFF